MPPKLWLWEGGGKRAVSQETCLYAQFYRILSVGKKLSEYARGAGAPVCAFSAESHGAPLYYFTKGGTP